ncbi:hemolysin family protein [[Clostridium] aminophilum]|uniref:hemolysin family protein n=1 Tax=[Clostridium] aminophilum TaxID=1526 RepID=UPI0026F1C00C|nr:hemolysin family protein [[Clostridium] aminophilum]MDD6196456.1 hemolysin family protein [[Clostridium] aminophilum]
MEMDIHQYWPAGILMILAVSGILAVFYGFGSAIQNLNQTELEDQSGDGDPDAKALMELIDEPKGFISSLHLIEQVLCMTEGVTGYLLLRDLPRAAIPAAILGTALFTVVFGIVIPRKRGADYPEIWAKRLLHPVSAVIAILSPFRAVIRWLSYPLLRLIGTDPAVDHEQVTRDDLKYLVTEGHENGVLKAQEAEMVNNVFELGKKSAGDIMTHRSGIVALDGEMILHDAVDFILNEAANSRFPVYLDTIDRIIGVIHIRDVLQFSEENKNRQRKLKELKGLIREPYFIPEIASIDQLFHQMQTRKVHMAVVIDEYGQTAGLITMEDILEEIVGNIEDEYDEDEERITRRGDGSFLLAGDTPLEDVARALDIEFDEKTLESFETISGYLIGQLGRIPEEHEKPIIRSCGWTFRVRDVRRRTLHLIYALKPGANAAAGGAQAAEAAADRIPENAQAGK